MSAHPPVHSSTHPLVKVCGMTRRGNILDIARAGATHAGLIFYAPSPRNALSVSPDEVSALPIPMVGVFVNADVDTVADTAQRYGLWAVQMHGKETPEMCAALRQRGLRVWKALGIASVADVQRAAEYRDAADMLVLDTKTDSHGGSGQKFSWHVLDNIALPMPFLLSGGIGPDDAAAIRRFAHPQCCGVDLNSRFEIAPGLKNARAVHDFVSAIKS